MSKKHAIICLIDHLTVTDTRWAEAIMSEQQNSLFRCIRRFRTTNQAELGADFEALATKWFATLRAEVEAVLAAVAGGFNIRIDLSPDPEFHFHKGLGYRKVGEETKALRAFQHALELAIPAEKHLLACRIIDAILVARQLTREETKALMARHTHMAAALAASHAWYAFAVECEFTRTQPTILQREKAARQLQLAETMPWPASPQARLFRLSGLATLHVILGQFDLALHTAADAATLIQEFPKFLEGETFMAYALRSTEIKAAMEMFLGQAAQALTTLEGLKSALSQRNLPVPKPLLDRCSWYIVEAAWREPGHPNYVSAVRDFKDQMGEIDPSVRIWAALAISKRYLFGENPKEACWWAQSILQDRGEHRSIGVHLGGMIIEMAAYLLLQDWDNLHLAARRTKVALKKVDPSLVFPRCFAAHATTFARMGAVTQQHFSHLCFDFDRCARDEAQRLIFTELDGFHPGLFKHLCID